MGDMEANKENTMTAKWIVLRRWGSGVWRSAAEKNWQPACQLTFDTQEAATAHMLDLVPDFPGREFKVVEQKKA
jgi:hypothetical protein